jgi:hypothetical protein
MNNTYLPGVIAIPSTLNITAITNDLYMVVTVSEDIATEDNTYIEGQLVKLYVPVTYGMWQANGLVGKIIAVDEDEIILNINSLSFDPFVYSASALLGPATLSPNGSRNLAFSNDTAQVPFQSLNNIGN